MKNLSSNEIKARLEEIAREQGLHAGRDFDSELKDILVKGGDIDALEESQLQAERVARRLRVESQALESTLPEVVQREAELELVKLKAEMANQVGQAKKIVKELQPLTEKAAALLMELWDLDVERIATHSMAVRIVRKNKLPDHLLEGTGQLMSEELESSKQQLRDSLSFTTIVHKKLEGLSFDEQWLERTKFGAGQEYITYKVNI